MQLILETETALDIDRNMSTVEDIQSNLVDNLDIEDLNDKKCNGNNKVKGVTKIAKSEENKQDSNEIEQSLSNILTDDEDNEAELSNVDLSEIISKQHNLEADAAQIDESQRHSPAKEVNGIDIDEKEIINVPEDIPEEDYMEDDIISIREEPYDIISEPQTEDVITNGEEKTIHGQNCPNQNDTMNIEEEIKEASDLCDKTIAGEEKDVIELFDDEVNDDCEKETEIPAQEEKDDIEIIEESEGSPAKTNTEKESPTVLEKDNIEFIVESPYSASQCEEENIPQSHDKKYETEHIEKSNNVPVEQITEMNMMLNDEEINTDRPTEKESLDYCENKINSPSEDRHGIINIEDADKSDVDEQDNKTLVESKSDTDDPVKENDVNTITVQTKAEEEIVSKSDLSTENEKEEIGITKEVIETSILCENEQEMVKETEDIEKTDVPSVQSHHKTNAALDISNDTNEIMENADTNEEKAIESIDSSKYESVEEGAKADDSPNVSKDVAMDVEEVADETKITAANIASPIELRDDMDVEETVENTTNNKTANSEVQVTAPVKNVPVNNIIDKPIICKLSNTLDILSDDDEEEEPPKDEPPKVATPELAKVSSPKVTDTKEKLCINLEDDDDIMLIDEDTNKTKATAPTDTKNEEQIPVANPDTNIDSETGEKAIEETQNVDKDVPIEKPQSPVAEPKDSNVDININEKTAEPDIIKPTSPPPLVPDNFLKTAKKKLSDMTRDELEEFCILKIVESIVDRTSLSDIKNKLKSMTQGLEEYRKKAMMLTKQNRDLQVVLKSVQEEQKKAMGDTPITPLKITRSVGMQVFMEKTAPRKKGPQQNVNNKPANTIPNRTVTSQAPRLPKPVTQQIPVPRLVPANNPGLKTPSTIPQITPISTPNKNTNPPNGLIKTPSPSMKPEKRPHSKMASGSSVTVDLTDDEPPAKMPGGPKTSPAPPVRLVNPQNLMAPQRQAFGPGLNSPRKVYIPISGPQSQPLRPGQTIMLKTVPATGIRPRCPTSQVTRIEPNNAVRMNRVAARHPAPLPSGMKQYQPPNWKGLPPAPDLKLSKVENGIVISWKIEGVPQDSYEEIASYQLFAYQETSAPPSTTLWKKIGDVKALPLPMACTLTQFMAGYKYYFAVRAVDIRSRFGPFSLPGSILLLSKNV